MDTGAVVITLPVEGEFPNIWSCDSDRRELAYRLPKDARIYGLGETVRGMNKRGWLYSSSNTDEADHLETKHSLYAAHNFFLIDSRETKFGFFVDTPERVDFDFGYTDLDMAFIRLETGNADLYIIYEASCLEIVKEFRHLIGKSYVPPEWALGFGYSRWGLKNEEDVRKIVRNYRENGIPLDMVYLDIDYMDHYKDFTVDQNSFPDFPAFVKEMKEQGIRLIPIIDAGVKVEAGYPVYEEGRERGYFCKKENGEDYTAAAWPGKIHLPDFLNEEARRWFGDQYQTLVDAGIDGFWNDMNEPAIFYSEDRLKEVFEHIDQYREMNLDVQSFFSFRKLPASLSDNPEDYGCFYHNIQGRKIRHDQVHNLYGYYMTRAAGEAFERLAPGRRVLLFSRSSYIGAHRYGGIWTGDNKAWWSHLLLNIQQMPALNMCGFLFSGADIGGFRENCTEDLLLRWTEFGIFTPLFRNHAANGTRPKEFYSFHRKQDFANLVKIRYSLVPYIKSELMKAIEEDGMYMMPLAFAYPEDERACHIEDQLLVGDSIMIAPVYTQNAAGRYVYLPEDMFMLRMRSPEDFDNEVVPQGDHYIPVSLNEVLVFIRPGHRLPLAEPAQTVKEIDYHTLKYLSFR